MSITLQEIREQVRLLMDGPVDADTLDGLDSTAFSLSGHDHSGVYSVVSHTHSYLPLAGGTMVGQVGFDNSFADTAGFLYAHDENGREILVLASTSAPASDRVGLQIYSADDSGGPRVRSLINNAVVLDVVDGQIQLPSGTASLPSVSFTSDPDTGFYRAGTNNLGMAVGGVRVFGATSDGIYTPDGTQALPGMAFLSDNDLGIYRSAANTLAFSVGNRTKIEITPGASGGLGSPGFTTAAGFTAIEQVGINGDAFVLAAFRNGAAACFFGRANNSTGTVVDFRNNGNAVGTISVTTTNTAYNTSSDRRLKRRIRDHADALSVLAGLRVRDFEWKSSGVSETGLIAQEVEKVIPSVVETGDDGFKFIDYGRLTPWLVGGMQQLVARVEALEAAHG